MNGSHNIVLYIYHSPVRCECISEPTGVSGQFVGPVVRIGDEGAPLGDRGYVPVVVVGVFVGGVAAVLVVNLPFLLEYPPVRQFELVKSWSEV